MSRQHRNRSKRRHLKDANSLNPSAQAFVPGPPRPPRAQNQNKRRSQTHNQSHTQNQNRNRNQNRNHIQNQGQNGQNGQNRQNGQNGQTPRSERSQRSQRPQIYSESQRSTDSRPSRSAPRSDPHSAPHSTSGPSGLSPTAAQCHVPSLSLSDLTIPTPSAVLPLSQQSNPCGDGDAPPVIANTKESPYATTPHTPYPYDAVNTVNTVNTMSLSPATPMSNEQISVEIPRSMSPPAVPPQFQFPSALPAGHPNGHSNGLPDGHPNGHLNELQMPQIAHFPQPGDMTLFPPMGHLALIPAVDQNGCLVMIPPYLLSNDEQDSVYTPIHIMPDNPLSAAMGSLTGLQFPAFCPLSGLEPTSGALSPGLSPISPLVPMPKLSLPQSSPPPPAASSSIEQIVKGIQRKFKEILDESNGNDGNISIQPVLGNAQIVCDALNRNGQFAPKMEYEDELLKDTPECIGLTEHNPSNVMVPPYVKMDPYAPLINAANAAIASSIKPQDAQQSPKRSRSPPPVNPRELIPNIPRSSRNIHETVRCQTPPRFKRSKSGESNEMRTKKRRRVQNECHIPPVVLQTELKGVNGLPPRTVTIAPRETTHILPPPPPMEVRRSQEKKAKVLDSKVVYLKERGNRSNRGFAQYSRSPVTKEQATKSSGRRKQSITGMRFAGKRTKDVHPCFKESPELLARDAFESVMGKLLYRPPVLNAIAESNQSNGSAVSNIVIAPSSPLMGLCALNPLSTEQQAVRVMNCSLNKLTRDNFENLALKCTSTMKELGIRELSTLNILGEAFHSKVIMQKPFAELYCDFLVELSTTLVVHGRNLKDIVLELSWKAIDTQHSVHGRYVSESRLIENFHLNQKKKEMKSMRKMGIRCKQWTKEELEKIVDDDVATKTLRTEYNLWLERLFGNYVVITQLYCMGRGNFVYDRLHQVMLSLIDVNEAWAWKCVFVVLTFHGVALQKKQCQCLEAYLEAIDELVDAIEYEKKMKKKSGKKPAGKYSHIPLQIKYLLMSVQEHIETQNARLFEGHGFLDCKKVVEVHAEFCREHGMTQEELKKVLSAERIESMYGNDGKFEFELEMEDDVTGVSLKTTLGNTLETVSNHSVFSPEPLSLERNLSDSHSPVTSPDVYASPSNVDQQYHHSPVHDVGAVDRILYRSRFFPPRIRRQREEEQSVEQMEVQRTKSKKSKKKNSKAMSTPKPSNKSSASKARSTTSSEQRKEDSVQSPSKTAAAAKWTDRISNKKTDDRISRKSNGSNPLQRQQSETAVGPLYLRNHNVPAPPTRAPPAVPTLSKQSKRSSRKTVKPQSPKTSGTPKPKRSSKKSGTPKPRKQRQEKDGDDGWITVKGSTNVSEEMKDRIQEALEVSMKEKESKKEMKEAKESKQTETVKEKEERKKEKKEKKRKQKKRKENVKEANSPKKSAKTTKRKKEKTPDVDGVFDVESKEKEQTPSIQSEPSLSNQKKSLKREKRKSRTSPKSKDKKPNRRDLSPVPFPFIKDVEVDQKKEEEKDTVKPSVSPKVTSPSTSPAAPSVAPSPKRKEKKMKKKKSKKNKHKKSKKSSPRNLVSPHKITWGAQKESGSSNGTLDKLKDSKESKSKKMGNGEGEKWITTEVKVEEDTTNYRDSDDEMWCESSSSEDEEDEVIPAFLFGADDEEDLNNALFCEIIDSMDEDDSDEEDSYGFGGCGGNKKYYRYQLPSDDSEEEEEDEVEEEESQQTDDQQIEVKQSTEESMDTDRIPDLQPIPIEESPKMSTADSGETKSDVVSDENSECKLDGDHEPKEAVNPMDERPIKSQETTPSHFQIEMMIVELLERYKESRDEAEVFAFLSRYTVHRDLFLTQCMKMFIGLCQIEDKMSKQHCAEIERLFVDRMYSEKMLDSDDYVRAVGALSTYFTRLVRCDGRNGRSVVAVSKLLVSLIEHGILTLSTTQCVVSQDVCREMTKYLEYRNVNGMAGTVGQLASTPITPNKVVQDFSSLKSPFSPGTPNDVLGSGVEQFELKPQKLDFSLFAH